MSAHPQAVDDRIRSVTTTPLFLPFKSNFKIAAGGQRAGIHILILELQTEGGVTGVGETQAWLRQGSRETIASLNSIIHEHFVPRLVGRSVFAQAAILAELEETVWHSNYAIAAVADAMLDAQGKILGVPAYQLLGGRARESVAAGITMGIKADPREMVEEARHYHEQGFGSFTVKVGNDPAKDAKAVHALVDALQDRILIRADGNAGMDWAGAVQFMNSVEPLGLDAVEQLLPQWDVDGMADLARRYKVPLLADECVSCPQDLLRVIKLRAADGFQTKIAKNGGAWRCKALWEVGAAAGMRIMPGNHPNSSVATSAALHLATAWPGPLLEGPIAVGINEHLADDIITTPIRRDGKHMFVSERPGLGVELDPDKIAKYRIDR